MTLRGDPILPLAPGNHAEAGPGRLRKHREKLEQVSVGVAEINGDGGHPAEDDRLAGRLAIEIERSAPCFAQSLRRSEHGVDAYFKRQVEAYLLRTRSGLPKPKHCFACRTDPEEGHAALRETCATRSLRVSR